MTTPVTSPLDQALRSRPRGNPVRPPVRTTKIIGFPADYDPRRSQNPTAVAALTAVQKIWTGFKELHDAGRKPLPELSRTAYPAIERALKHTDDARAALLKEREETEKAIAKAIGAADAHAAAVRAHFKSLKPADALTLAQARVAAGDRVTAAALLDGPAYLSGLSDKTRDAVRDLAERRFAPDQVAAREVLDRDVELVTRAGARLGNEIALQAIAWEKGDDDAKLKKLAEDDVES